MRMRKQSKWLFGSAAALAMLFAAGLYVSGEEINKEMKQWLEDDVRYIITDEERDEFDQLATNKEREAFVEKFWARRDPNPNTQINEYRVEHYRRTEAANRLFRAEGKPGWMTNRGKIFIIFGPPDERNEEILTSSGGSSASGAAANATDRETWVYRNPKNKILGPNAEIRFVKIRDQYVLETEIESSPEDLLFNARVDNVSRHSDVDQETSLKDIKIVESGQAEGAAGRDLEETMLTGLLAGEAPQQDFSYQYIPVFFPTPQEFTYVSICFHVDHNDMGFEKIEDQYAANLEIFGIVMQGEEKINDFKVPYLVTETTQEYNRNADTPIHFSMAMYLKPGTYDLYTGLLDRNGQRVSGKKEALEVVGYDPAELDTSTILLVENISSPRGGEFAPNKVLPNLNIGGQLEIVPNVNRVFSNTESILLFYNVCGLQLDENNQPSLSILYTLFKAGEEIHQFPEVENQTGIIEQTVPLKGLEPGDYSLKIRIKDKLSKAQVERTVDFSIS